MADVLKQQAEPLVLEFGSGWSSVWFAARCSRLVTVETDPRWWDVVENDLAESGFNNWLLYKAEVPPDPRPVFLDEAQADLVLADCREILDEAQADLVLVDSREDLRFAAARLGWSLLKPGGWLIFDDTHRPEYAAPIKYLRNFAVPVELKYRKGYDVGTKGHPALAWKKPPI
jgi:predicted O-methyltransferase YrrM